jgi:hypothetical protein
MREPIRELIQYIHAYLLAVKIKNELETTGNNIDYKISKDGEKIDMYIKVNKPTEKINISFISTINKEEL